VGGGGWGGWAWVVGTGKGRGGGSGAGEVVQLAGEHSHNTVPLLLHRALLG
jgi:hypothetical protein